MSLGIIVRQDLCTADGAVEYFFFIQFRFHPFHDSFFVEDVMAWSFTDLITWCKVFHTDCATLLIIFELRVFELFEHQNLFQFFNRLLVLLFENALGSQWVMPTMPAILRKVCIFDRIVCLGPILAEDAKGSAATNTA